MGNTRMVTMDVSKEYLKFSAAHFTIFSAESRERLHGHNFAVQAQVKFPVDETGINFDYKEFKEALKAICDSLDEYTIIAAKSKFLTIQEEGDFYRIGHHDTEMFLRKDETLLLPISNSTIEELSYYLLGRLLENKSMIDGNEVQYVAVKTSSGPGQWATSDWYRP